MLPARLVLSKPLPDRGILRCALSELGHRVKSGKAIHMQTLPKDVVEKQDCRKDACHPHGTLLLAVDE